MLGIATQPPHFQDNRLSGLDSDALTYIRAVETADGDILESGVITAINNFFVGCKSDGIFNALNCTNLLMGARTIAGILIPLKGDSIHTNVNYVSSDYNRITGLLSRSGTGITTDFADTDLTANDNHYFTGASSIVRTSFNIITYSRPNTLMMIQHGNASQGMLYFNSNSSPDSLDGSTSAGLYGTIRSSSSGYTAYRPNVSSYFARTSQTHQGGEFAYTIDDTSRLDFHSIGGALDYALLNARYTTLKSEIATALT